MLDKSGGPCLYENKKPTVVKGFESRAGDEGFRRGIGGLALVATVRGWLLDCAAPLDSRTIREGVFDPGLPDRIAALWPPIVTFNGSSLRPL
jgi:hypothetical protein